MNHLKINLNDLEVIFLMREQSYQQFAIVHADSASILTERLNEKLKELKDKEPTVTFDGNTARICYVERFDIPEDLGDSWSLKGVHLKCSDCPFFEPIEKADGTSDERRKWGRCPCAKMGKAFSDEPMCNSAFKMINEGSIKLCLG